VFDGGEPGVNYAVCVVCGKRLKTVPCPSVCLSVPWTAAAFMLISINKMLSFVQND